MVEEWLQLNKSQKDTDELIFALTAVRGHSCSTFFEQIGIHQHIV